MEDPHKSKAKVLANAYNHAISSRQPLFHPGSRAMEGWALNNPLQPLRRGPVRSIVFIIVLSQWFWRGG